MINFDAMLGNHVAALELRARRSAILASNLANADTPNYKARDINFKAALKSAMGDGMAPLKLDVTNPADIQPADLAQPGGQLLYRVPLQPSLDGNTVDVHAEQAAFADNAMHYEISLQFLSGRFKSMIKALQVS